MCTAYPRGVSEPHAPGIPPRRRGRSTVSFVLLAIVVAFAVYALARNWSEVTDDIAQMSVLDLVLSTGSAAIGLFFSAFAWRSLLGGMGASPRLHDAFTIYFAGQLGKYVPGSVWPAVIQAELGRRSNIARLTMVASYVVALMVALATGSVIGLLVLFGPARDSLWPAVVGAATLGVALGVLLYDARWLNRAGAWAGTRIRREIPSVHTSPRSVVLAAVLQLCGWVFWGLHAWLIARPLGAGADLVLPTIGGFAFAFVAGLVVIPLPAGAGIREAVLIVMLSGDIGRPGAITVSLVSRLLMAVAELLLAALFGVRRAAGYRRSSATPPVEHDG